MPTARIDATGCCFTAKAPYAPTFAAAAAAEAAAAAAATAAAQHPPLHSPICLLSSPTCTPWPPRLAVFASPSGCSAAEPPPFMERMMRLRASPRAWADARAVSSSSMRARCDVTCGEVHVRWRYRHMWGSTCTCGGSTCTCGAVQYASWGHPASCGSHILFKTPATLSTVLESTPAG